ncbi:hypothetical protein NCCP691_33130 [Noviherbaspirillum aridicola]|uniref:MMPL family protein n=1 Tax=Noviherbaspirillum aridicola TaxID=2849687 RepID=A0ABQ4Q9C8_9BURK|nr:hypothetical protein NCCP691_33130 [Noviherbaspirillum aridicola]
MGLALIHDRPVPIGRHLHAADRVGEGLVDDVRAVMVTMSMTMMMSRLAVRVRGMLMPMVAMVAIVAMVAMVAMVVCSVFHDPLLGEKLPLDTRAVSERAHRRDRVTGP